MYENDVEIADLAGEHLNLYVSGLHGGIQIVMDYLQSLIKNGKLIPEAEVVIKEIIQALENSELEIVSEGEDDDKEENCSDGGGNS